MVVPQPEQAGGRLMNRARAVMIAVLMMLSVVAAAARSQSADAKAVVQHRLTLDLIRRAIAVDRDLVAALKKDPALMKRAPEKTAGIDGSAAMMNKIPEVARILEANGISARDYLLTQLSMFTTALAHEYMLAGKLPPPKPDTPMHNLEFWKQNLEAVKPLETEWKALRAELLKYSK